MAKSKSVSTESSAMSFRRDNKPSPSSTRPARRAPARKGQGGGKKSAWSEPSAAELEQSILTSRLPLRVALRVRLVDAAGDTAVSTLVKLPVADAARNDDMAEIVLLECGVNTWEELVEMQRLLDRHSMRARLPCRAMVTPFHHLNEEQDDDEDRDEDEWRVQVQLQASAVDTLWREANNLMLRLNSLGLPARSLLAESISLSLWEGQAEPRGGSFECMGELQCKELIVMSVSPEQVIQRVKLAIEPASRIVYDPLAAVRYPELVSLVDEMLEAFEKTGSSQVVILRGVPGSGKSSLGREIATIAHDRGAETVVCSADLHFETPRGYVFDPKELTRAHERAQASFADAISGIGKRRAKIVVVDNTNTQRWEYETYENAARQANCGVHILEMRCPDVPTCLRMAQRNSHGVPAVKVIAMFQRWEHDDRARVFSPQFEFPLLTPNPITRPALKLSHHHVAPN
ncbi:hypothetical protein ATCC90586_007034 [Pythium insidiosum]|nr:hypothetical protein ATCC90586_007034 [Pythium insidiosum]